MTSMIKMAALVAVGATMLQVSCGSDDSSGGSGNTGGAQTGGTGGASTCTAGDTRSCTGPGACQGGQTCEPSGTWGACDCGSGGSGGAGGTAGSTSGGAAGTGGGAGTGGSGPTPTKLADISGTPGNLAVRGSVTFFASETSGAWDIKKCDLSKACAGGPTSPETGVAEPKAIGNDGSGTQYGRSGASGVHLSLASNGLVQVSAASSFGLAFGGQAPNQTVVWGEAATVYACQGDLSKCASNKVTLAQGMARAVALDNASAYWAGYDTGVIGQCPLSGCAGNPTIIASGQTQPDALSVDGIHVVWRTNNSILTKCTSTGCSATPTVLASAQDDATVPSSVVAQGGDVFWTNPTAGTVMKCPVAGCSNKPAVIATGQNSAAGIGATTTTVYWLSTSGLMSLPR